MTQHVHMQGMDRLMAEIIEKTGVEFRAASLMDLAKLDALGVPLSVLDFYAEYEPGECAEYEVRLWPIEHVLEESEALVPGCRISKDGFIVFATTTFGDVYCFDLSPGDHADPRIVLISHEVITENMTAAGISRLAKPVARNLRDFLDQFARRELDEKWRWKTAPTKKPVSVGKPADDIKWFRVICGGGSS